MVNTILLLLMLLISALSVLFYLLPQHIGVKLNPRTKCLSFVEELKVGFSDGL